MKQTPIEAVDIPSPDSLFRKLLWIAALYAGVTILGGVAILTPAMTYTQRQIMLAITIQGPLVGVAVVLADVLSMAYISRPVRRGLEAIKAGETGSDTIRRALVRALNLPVYTVIRVLVPHVLTSVGATVVTTYLLNRYMNLGVEAEQTFLILFVGVTAVAPTHAILEYFAVLNVVRPVIPHLQERTAELSPTLQASIIPTNIRRRLLFITVSMSLIPIIVLSVVVTLQLNDAVKRLGMEDALLFSRPLITWIGILMVVVAGFMMAIALAMSKDIHELTSKLSNAMREVESGNLNPHLYVTTTDEFAALYRGFNDMTQGLRDRVQLHEALGRYLAPELAEKILEDENSMRGELVNASVVFIDIRGFTALSETLPPREVVALLNRYFSLVEPIIEEYDGWINKFLGDGLMILFGVPIFTENHTERAVRAALDIIATLERFNDVQLAQNAPIIDVGIGISAGDMIAGRLGGENRVEYTVVGDVVNTAARIEALNKAQETRLLISESVYQAVKDQFEAREMSPVKVKGKAEPLKIYALA